MFHAQQQDAGLCGNRDFDLVSDSETGAALPIFLGQKDPQVVPQLCLLLGTEETINAHVLFQVLQPGRRERRPENSRSTALLGQNRERERGDSGNESSKQLVLSNSECQHSQDHVPQELAILSNHFNMPDPGCDTDQDEG